MKNLAKKAFLVSTMVMFLSMTVVNCGGLSKEELEKQVAASIEETINGGEYGRNPSGFNPYTNFEVESVSLVKRSDNEYSGIVTIIGTRAVLSQKEKLTESLTVFVDKNSFQWRFE